MKKQLVGILILTFCLVTGFLILSCAPGAQNTNITVNQNANVSVSPTQWPSDLPSDEDICKMTNTTDKIDLLKRKLLEKIEKQDKNIEKQFKGEGNYPPIFKYDFVPASSNSNDIFLIVEGRISGETKLKKVVDFIEDFVKKTCTQKVYFVPAGTLPMTPTKLERLDVTGFEWFACEYPMVPCPGGTCDYPNNCSRLTNLDSANTAANANSGINDNRSMNVNSNMNRNP